MADGRDAHASFVRMARILQRVERTLGEHLRAYDLTPGLFDVVLRVAEDEGLPQHELAGRLFHTPANVSILLDKLDRMGLVRRERAGRARHVYLTDRGREVYREVAPAHEAILAAQLAHLSREERQAFARLLRSVERGPPSFAP